MQECTCAHTCAPVRLRVRCIVCSHVVCVRRMCTLLGTWISVWGGLYTCVCLGALGTALPALDSTRGLSPIHKDPPSVSPVPSAPQGRLRSQKCPTQTWSATRIVIGASRTLLSLSKYFPASSGRERLKETGGTRMFFSSLYLRNDKMLNYECVLNSDES